MIRRRDRGSTTAELAVASPVLVLLLLASLTGIGAMVTKLRCVDAARESALAAARGAPAPPVPVDATVEVGGDGDLVRVVIRARVRPLGPYVPAITVTGEAVAMREPLT